MEIRHHITHLKAAWMGSHSVLTKPSNSNFGLEKMIQKEMVKNNDWYAWLDMYNIGNNNTKKIIILLREYCIRSTKNSCHVKIEGTLHNCFPRLFLLRIQLSVSHLNFVTKVHVKWAKGRIVQPWDSSKMD